jgi:hypothetical protein
MAYDSRDRPDETFDRHPGESVTRRQRYLVDAAPSLRVSLRRRSGTLEITPSRPML